MDVLWFCLLSLLNLPDGLKLDGHDLTDALINNRNTRRYTQSLYALEIMTRSKHWATW